MLLPNLKEARTRNNIEYKRVEYVLDKKFKNSFTGYKYHLKTYGCQMNEHDSENIKAILEEMGFIECDNYMEADLIILNTCSIRENANNKAFGMLGRIKHLKETNKDLMVALCGCMAQEEKVIRDILSKYRFVNFVFGTHNINRLPNLLDENFKTKKQVIEVFSREGDLYEALPVKRESNHKAYVNIIYGCDKFCTYCIVPYTRGKQRSRLMEDILKEVNDLIKRGYKEVTLLGQNVNAYGKDLNLGYSMENLLEEVAKTGIERIRFVTSHPWDFTDKMIDVIAKHPNIMPSIHLPLQSGSNKILKMMGRRYTKEEYLVLFNKLKEKVSNCTISTDIIVGFPNESEEDFNETLDLVEKCKFDNAFTFIYSKREGTPAAKMEDFVSLEEKEERLQKLNQRVNHYFLINNQNLIGEKVKVLVDGVSQKKGNDKILLMGYTDTNKLINFEGDLSLIGSIVTVEVVDAKTWSLDGKIVE